MLGVVLTALRREALRLVLPGARLEETNMGRKLVLPTNRQSSRGELLESPRHARSPALPGGNTFQEQGWGLGGFVHAA